MSFFNVTIETLEKVYQHPNADALELGKLVGCEFQFVIKKDQYKAGDKVIYFPVDSLIPEKIAIEMGLERLVSNGVMRVRTIKLRSQISQGIVLQLLTIDVNDPSWMETEDNGLNKLTNHLGVTKYEPPVSMSACGMSAQLPGHMSVYDIEGFQRYPEVLARLLELPCEITEKAEGCNSSYHFGPSGYEVCSRSLKRWVTENDDPRKNIWVYLGLKYGLDTALEKTCTFLGFDSISVFGEGIGQAIQNNIYGLPNQELKIFDMKVNGKWIVPSERYKVLEIINNFTKENLTHTPILFHNSTLPLKEAMALENKTIEDFFSGKSLISPKPKFREGIVIKPEVEEYITGFGRLFVKYRDPNYLEWSGM